MSDFNLKLKANSLNNNDLNQIELLAILFVSKGDGGDHLLFKYPFSENKQNQNNKKGSYSLTSTDSWITEKEKKNVSNGIFRGLENSIIASICMTHKSANEPINKPLELKIDNIFFLASSSYLNFNSNSFSVVFAVKSPLPKPVISCYQSLSLAITKTLMKEQLNSNYVSEQSKKLSDCVDQADQCEPFSRALSICSLAREFKTIYENIIADGIIDVTFNNNLHLSFCLPHIAYKIKEKCEQTLFVDAILKAANNLRPYLAILLLVPKEVLLQTLPEHCNYYVKRVIQIYNPKYCFARYASELDVPIKEIYSVVDHLIHWAKVKIIYPITDNNIYTVHPNADIIAGNKLHLSFVERFPQVSLTLLLEKFSQAKALADHMTPDEPKDKHLLFLEVVIWLLERNLLIQLHTYVYLLVKKVDNEYQQFDYSKRSETSLDNTYDLSGQDLGASSEHSNETDNTDLKDKTVLQFENYRKILAKHNIVGKQQQCILKSFQNKNEREIKLFLRLLPYYDGQSNLEEITYYEKLNRSELNMLLDIFKDLLNVCVYEDSNPLIRINVRID